MKKGFTIIELMVAMTIFIVVISISSGVFINSLKTQRSVLALMAANDNASLTIEQISREIRTGSEFQTNGSGDRLEFVSAGGNPVIYQLQNNSIRRNGEAITAGNVKVEYLLFKLQGEAPDDRKSTRVTINLGVNAVGKGLTDFVTNIQTTISARRLDA
ncbi:MAG: prepilin-type N-terminal cleavage/methylation domain-containing protein [Patescibacteria group bacterium]